MMIPTYTHGHANPGLASDYIKSSQAASAVGGQA